MTSASAEPQGEDVSSQAIILEPVTECGIDVLLLFFPGALTPPQAYFPLINTIQKKSTFRLWATVLDPGKQPISPPMIEATFDGMIKRVKDHGFEPGELSINRIFVAGHSLGAWCSRSISKKKAEGFIQMGSFFHTNPDNLAQYPKPVLSLGGGLDGQLGVGGFAKHAGEIYTLEPEMGGFNTNAVKPVIIIPGMNHAQFSHGIPNKERGDLDAYISLEDARSQTAESIVSFLTLHVKAQDETRQLALENLSKGVKKTHALYKTFWEAIENQESQAKVWQIRVSGLQELAKDDVVVIKHDYLDNFVYSKPWIDTKGKRIFVQVYSSPADKFSIIKNIWIKMKSYDAIHELYGNSDKKSKIASAADFNAETFHEALSLTPEVSRRKFYESGKKLRFIEDRIITTSGQDWIDSDVIMKPAEDGSGFVDVQSTVVITPVHGIASRFAGMHYMKLLSGETLKVGASTKLGERQEPLECDYTDVVVAFLQLVESNPTGTLASVVRDPSLASRAFFGSERSTLVCHFGASFWAVITEILSEVSEDGF
ncbi:hypothetical protein KI387_022989 [Taxus chinensis]|uniref:Uncharacterized protein n=1 Tax=Taxus chinensis TaxID=29808 RepID=A0AA38LBB5_TAXCH|nr:hypothetical protein KI387_022989 [Taxus chinensis]